MKLQKKKVANKPLNTFGMTYKKNPRAALKQFVKAKPGALTFKHKK